LYAQAQLPIQIPVTVKSNIDHLNVVARAVYLRSPDSARKVTQNALLLSEKYNYQLGKGESFLNLGHIYWSQSYYPVSLFYLNTALNYLPDSKPLELADCYSALGRTYADLKNYKQALNYLDKAYHFGWSDTRMLAEIYSERSYVYCAMKDYTRAVAAAKYALKLDEAINYKRNIAVLHGRLGGIYTDKKDFSTALAYDDTAYRLSFETNNKRLRAKTLAEYALINNKLGKFARAIGYAHSAIALADSIDFVDARTLAYNALVNSYQLTHNLNKALFFQKKYNALQDSVITSEKLKSILLIQNYFAFNSKMNSLALMEVNNRDNRAKIRSQQALITILIVSLVVLMIILSATYYLYKQKKILNSKLEQQHNALLDQKHLIEVQTVNLQMVNDLKDKLLTVIGHDLRTPVANLSNMVEMFEAGDLTAADVYGLMKNINPIVKGAELTLSNLLEWAGNQLKGRNVHFANVDIFLLGVEMEQTFKHALQLKNIEFVNNAYPGQSVLADENHLKVILRNLISNAIKFTNYKGTITLRTVV